MNFENRKHFDKIKKEIGENEFDKHFRFITGEKAVLDYVDTLVVNMPENCNANCRYCIDKHQKKYTSADLDKWFLNLERAITEFPNIKRISITGGSLDAGNFNIMISLIRHWFWGRNKPMPTINWNTNGYNIDRRYDIFSINYVNLHRQSISEIGNKTKFCFDKYPISIVNAKHLFKNKLFISITVTENFKYKEWINLDTNLYFHRLMPPSDLTDKLFYKCFNEINEKYAGFIEKQNNSRRNKYFDVYSKYSPVYRFSFGDEMQNHIHNRYPYFLNVVILHRNGKVCGSWYGDDKFLFE